MTAVVDEYTQVKEGDNWRMVRRDHRRGNERLDGDGVTYVQIRNARGGWGRKIRASPLANRTSFGKAYRTLIRNKQVPIPDGYRLVFPFIDDRDFFKLVKIERKKPVRRPPPPPPRVIKQFEIKTYTLAEKKQRTKNVEFVTYNGKRYERNLWQGQNMVVRGDITPLASKLGQDWHDGWATLSDEDGVDRTNRLVNALREMGREADTVADTIDSQESAWTENDTLVRFSPLRDPVNTTGVNRISYLSQLVREDPVGPLPKINSKFFSIGENMTVYKHLKSDKYMRNMCMFSVIMEAFLKHRERLEKKRETTFLSMLSYEGLTKFLLPSMTVEEVQERGVCVEDVVPFFQRWGVALHVYDIYAQERTCFVPDKPHHTIRPTRVNILIHERHAYLLNEHLDHLEKQDRPVIIKTSEDCEKIVPFYKAKPTIKEEMITAVQTVEEALSFAETVHNQNVGKRLDECDEMFCYVPDHLLPTIYYRLRTEWNYKASVVLGDTWHVRSVKVGAVTFKSQQSRYAGCAVYQNRDQLVSMVKTSEYLYRGFFSNSAWRSTYNGAVRQLLVAYKPSPVKWGFGHRARSTTKYDITKCYTSIVRDMECLVAFNGCDRLEEYNGEPLEDFCMYLVVKVGNTVSFPLKRYSLCFGKHLKTVVGGFRVLKVLRPSHRTSNYLVDKLKKVFTNQSLCDWENKGFVEDPRKYLSNTSVGMLGQHERDCWTGTVFDNLPEAVTFQEERGGGIRHFECDDEPTGLYLHYKPCDLTLKDGYLPLHHYVVEACVVKILDLLDDLRSCGYEAVSINTDCVEVETNREAELEFRRFYGKKWFKETGEEWDRLGYLRVEQCDRPTKKDRTEVFENHLVIPEDTTTVPEEVVVEDEWKLDLRTVGNKCAVEAIMAGSGKTFVSKQIADEEDMLFVVPNHKIETNLLRDGYDAVTVDHLLGFHPARHADGVEFEQGKMKTKFVLRGQETDLFSYKYITFDELLLLPVNKVYAVKEFVDKYESSFSGVFFNYDPFQNRSPDERLANIDPNKVRSYKLRICREIAGKYVVLREMKRNTNPENTKHYKSMKQMLDRNDLAGMVTYLLNNCTVIGSVPEVSTNMNIAYTNPQCVLIGDHVYRRLHGDCPWGAGLRVIYKGMTQKVTGCRNRFYKNDDYTIVSVENDKVLLRHVLGEESTVSIKQLKSFFKLPYCWTGHSTQGSTIDVQYTIDINFPFTNCEWLWTAVTRCTDWSLITVLYNEKLREMHHKRFVQKVEDLIHGDTGYIQQDIRAGRFIKCESDYIDTDWVIEHMKGDCCLCGEPMDVTGDTECFSVDRVDNSIAHVKSNCQIVHRYCNIIKR